MSKKRIVITALFIIAGGAWFFIALKVDYGWDWANCFVPAIKATVSSSNPYHGACPMNNPPWVYVWLYPLSLLPVAIGRAILATISFVCYSVVAIRLGWSPIATLGLLFVPQLIFIATDGNLDGLTVLGYILPPWIGIFFVMIKPQIGIGVAIWWMYDTFLKTGLQGIIKTFWPFVTLYGLAFLMYGNDIFPQIGTFAGKGFTWNWSLWPISIPIGLILLVRSLENRNMNTAIIASPFLSPYVAFYSWPAAVLGISPSSLTSVAVIVGLWMAYLLKAV